MLIFPRSGAVALRILICQIVSHSCLRNVLIDLWSNHVSHKYFVCLRLPQIISLLNAIIEVMFIYVFLEVMPEWVFSIIFSKNVSSFIYTEAFDRF